MIQVNISEAKAQLSELIAKATKGEVVQICHRNLPVAELRALAPEAPPPRKLGLWKGRFVVPDDFNEPLGEEEMAEWERPLE